MKGKNARVIIPVITEGEIADFPPPSATSADVFAWIKSRCSEAELNSGGPHLSQVDAFTGDILHTSRASYVMMLLRTMGFAGVARPSIVKARKICGFILAARRLLTETRVVSGGGDRENLQSAQMFTNTTAELSTSATYASTSNVPASLPTRILEQQSSLEIRTTPNSNAVAVSSTYRTLLPSPIFAFPHKRTAREAALESDDENGDDREDVGGNNSNDGEHTNGSRRESDAASHNGNGPPEGVVEEEEFELCEEEDVIHDDEYIQGMFDEYEDMTPLEARREWGHTPYDCDTENHHFTDEEDEDDDAYDLDARLHDFLGEGVAGEDIYNEDADDVENEEQSESYGRSEKFAKHSNDKARLQDFIEAEVVDDITNYEDASDIENDEEGRIYSPTIESTNRNNSEAILRGFMEKEITAEDAYNEDPYKGGVYNEDTENEENEEYMESHGRSKKSVKRNKRAKLTEAEEFDEPAVPDDGRTKCVVGGLIYDLFADD